MSIAIQPPAVVQASRRTPEADPCCPPLRSEPLDADQARTLAHMFAALADPVRLRLLSLIASDPSGAVCACDLVDPIGRSQPTVSHHLKVLREAGLITSDRRGVNIWYSVIPDTMESLRVVLSEAPPRI